MKFFVILLFGVFCATATFAQQKPPDTSRNMLNLSRGVSNNILSQNAEPPCTPSTTTGTITLTLTACSSTINGVGYWQVTLTGNATLAVTGGNVGSGFQFDVIEGSTPFTLSVPLGMFFPATSLCTGSGAPVAYCTVANQLVLSGLTGGKNTFYCRVHDNTPSYWCGAVQAGLVQASTGTSVWNPADKNASVTLSTTTQSNDTATQNLVTGSYLSVRGTQSYTVTSANKKIIKYILPAVSNIGTVGLSGTVAGFADGSVSLGNYIGNSAHAVGVQPNGSDYLDGNGGASATCANTMAVTTPVTVYMAVNFNNGHVFCSADCITWTGNPTADTGQAFTLSAATYFPAWSGSRVGGAPDTGQIITDGRAIQTPASGACTNISGFSNWG